MVASRWLSAFAVAVLMSGCSSAEEANESLGTQTQELTGGCGFGSAAFANVGFPCDPDGSGSLTECDHVCTLRAASSGGVTVQCVKVTTAGSNDGKLCGSSRGTDCTKQCKGSLCVAINAADGTACNPSTTFGGSHCGGECLSGKCTAIPDTARCNEIPNNCALDTCTPTKARTCTSYPVPRGTTCNDSNVCTTGDVCDGVGKCGGTTKTCPASGSPCLVNACDPTTTTGTCIAKPQAGATCAFDKCFAGVCSSTGTCVKGTAISCDDSDACTTDSCDATTGCKHDPKACPAPDACSTATCDKTTGACGSTTKSCDDGNPCTTDTCDTTSGCKNTPILGCTFVPDAGVDTGIVPVRDTGVLPIDTGVIEPTDTGVVEPTDSGSIEEDTGSTTIEDTGTSTTDDSGVADTGDDAGAGFEETVESGGCGCRTTSTSGSTTYAALSLAALGLVAARRRRSA